MLQDQDPQETPLLTKPSISNDSPYGRFRVGGGGWLKWRWEVGVGLRAVRPELFSIQWEGLDAQVWQTD